MEKKQKSQTKSITTEQKKKRNSSQQHTQNSSLMLRCPKEDKSKARSSGPKGTKRAANRRRRPADNQLARQGVATIEPPLRKEVKVKLENVNQPSKQEQDGFDQKQQRDSDQKAMQFWKEIDKQWFSPLTPLNAQTKILQVLNYSLERDEIHEQLARQCRNLDELLRQSRLPQLTNMFDYLQNEQSIDQTSEEAAAKLTESLRLNRILRSFMRGFSDKTEKEVYERFELDSVEQRKTKEKIDTECKVCFNCDSEEQNKIVYCDKCSTSYHQNCYGLQHVPGENENHFCDCCGEFAHLPKKLPIFCRICRKRNFPMRKLEGQFYHLTCLFINNLVETKGRKIVFRKDVNEAHIKQLMTEGDRSTLVYGSFCQFCVFSRELRDGVQIPCSNSACNKTFHPICAYLHGCQFDICLQTRDGRMDLIVRVLCNEHDIKRDHAKQTYLRRFSLNLFNTFQKTYEQFTQEYLKSEANRLKEVARIQNASKQVDGDEDSTNN